MFVFFSFFQIALFLSHLERVVVVKVPGRPGTGGGVDGLVAVVGPVEVLKRSKRSRSKFLSFFPLQSSSHLALFTSPFFYLFPHLPRPLFRAEEKACWFGPRGKSLSPERPRRSRKGESIECFFFFERAKMRNFDLRKKKSFSLFFLHLTSPHPRTLALAYIHKEKHIISLSLSPCASKKGNANKKEERRRRKTPKTPLWRSGSSSEVSP